MQRLSLLLCLTACAKSAPPAEPLPQDLPSHMQLHYELATRARDAVIRGKLDVAKAAGQSLYQHSDARLPETWQPYIGSMNAAAKATMDAPSLDAAGFAVAQLASSCASCHEGLGGGPSFELTPAPPLGKEVRDKMARHQWAADRMWDGLIGPDVRIYQAGAEAISGAPVWGSVELPEPVQAIESGVRQIAQEAMGASEEGVRVVAYGQLLATCAECHSIARP